jgi:hypothetical protein
MDGMAGMEDRGEVGCLGAGIKLESWPAQGRLPSVTYLPAGQGPGGHPAGKEQQLDHLGSAGTDAMARFRTAGE